MSPKAGLLSNPAVQRRRMIEELLWSFAVPIGMICTHYIVQTSRYWIVGVNGCILTIDSSWPSYVLHLMWPSIFALIASGFAVLVIYRYIQRRKDFARYLADGTTGMTSYRFIRLLGLALLQILINLPITLYILFGNYIKVPLLSYSWDAIHNAAQWDYIIMLPASSVSVHYWIAPASAIALFIFFGFGTDAMMFYKSCSHTLRLDKVFIWKRCPLCGRNKETTMSMDAIIPSIDSQKYVLSVLSSI